MTDNFAMAHSAQPIVSIITPTFNSEKYLPKTIESVLSQTYAEWELILVDDASVDDTLAIHADYMRRDNRIRSIQLDKNSGAAVARNAGISGARGSYICFLDSDDLWRRNKLKLQLEFMSKFNIAFSYTAYGVVGKKDSTTGKLVDINALDKVGYVDMLKKVSTIGCSTVMLDTKQIGSIRFPLIRTGQDYALWLKLLRESDLHACCLKEVLVDYRITPGSISRNKFKKAMRQWEIYTRIEKLNRIYASWCFLHYTFRALFR